MDLSPIEHHVFAHYVANGAQEFNMVGRFWPYGELVLVIQDKIRVGVRKFGTRAGMAAPKAASAFLDLLIEREAFSTKQNDFGGTMHQFQPDTYRAVLEDLRQTDPVIQKAQQAGSDFWEQAFAGF